MTIIASIDGDTRRIFLHSDTVGASIHPIDIYKEMRSLRRLDESLRQYDLFMEAAGNVSKGGGKFTERYVTLLDGARLVPFDTSHQLTITGTIITDDGLEGILAFDRSSLSASSAIDIAYVPPQVEVIVVSTGGSALTQEEHDKLFEVHEANYNRRKHDAGNNTITIYGSDKSTPKHVFDTDTELSDITPQ